MGTINYKTSEFITLGYPVIGPWDIMQDEKYSVCKEEYKAMAGEMGVEFTEDFIDSVLRIDGEEQFINAREIVEQYHPNLDLFTVKIDPGYYSGFSLIIDQEYCTLDDEEERAEALEDIEQIEKVLVGLTVYAGMVQVYPGWCTAEKSFDETKEAIRNACDEMKRSVNSMEIGEWGVL